MKEYTDRRNQVHETIYSYGMRLRGFSIGCQPMKGLLFTADDESGRYHDLLVYNRKLTDKELSDYVGHRRGGQDEADQSSAFKN